MYFCWRDNIQQLGRPIRNNNLQRPTCPPKILLKRPMGQHLSKHTLIEIGGEIRDFSEFLHDDFLQNVLSALWIFQTFEGFWGYGLQRQYSVSIFKLCYRLGNFAIDLETSLWTWKFHFSLRNFTFNLEAGSLSTFPNKQYVSKWIGVSKLIAIFRS